DSRSLIYEKMLSGNYLWRGAGGATLALEPHSDRIVLQAQLELSGAHDELFTTWLGALADAAEFWSLRLAEANVGVDLNQAEESGQNIDDSDDTIKFSA